MPSGGARARAGRPQSPDSLGAEKYVGEWVELPAAGREGETPTWPLEQPTERELHLWEIEWHRPQALMWERNSQQLEVALYVRAVADAESPRASTAARTLVRQQMDSLGISVPGLKSNRWKIVAEDQAAAKPAPRRSRAKSRLRVVDGGQSSSAGADDGGRA